MSCALIGPKDEKTVGIPTSKELYAVMAMNSTVYRTDCLWDEDQDSMSH